MENVFLVTFADESEAYQAFDEVKENMYAKTYVVSHMTLVKKSNGKVTPCEGYDAKCHCPIANKTLGGLIGMVVGALAGPIGLVVGGAAGSFISGKLNSKEIEKAVAEIEHISKGMQEGEHALIAVVQEEIADEFEREFYKFKTNIQKKDAAQVSVEVEYAIKLHKQMDKWDKTQEIKESIEKRRAEIQTEFQNIRDSMKIVHDEMEFRTR